MAGSVARAFGRRVAEPLMDFPLELLAQRKDLWVAVLRHAMMRTQRGFRKPTLVNRPPQGAARWRGVRRADKPGTTKLSRRYGHVAKDVA
jgi:hypothetical protein